MNKILSTALLFFSLLMSTFVYAATAVTAITPTFPQVNWTSKDTHDSVKIENGNNTPIVIQINVNKVTNSSGVTGGINVSNCGKTTYIAAGSSAVCSNNDGSNPVTFTSDSANPISGVYQITQQ